MWHIWTLDGWEKNIDLEGKKYADNNLVYLINCRMKFDKR